MTRRRVLAIGAVVVLALLAGVADRAGGGGGQIAIPKEPLIVAAQTGLWLLIAAAVGYLVLMVWALVTDPSPIVAEPPRRRSLVSYLMLMLPTALMVAILYLRRPGAAANSLLGRFGLGAVPPAPPPGQGNPLQGPDTLWLSLLLASLIAGAFLAWLFWPAPRRPRPRARLITDEARQPVAAAVDDTIDALRAIADPRQAIIAAYSAMEASLRRAGVRRKRSDTPIEFLAHALSAVLGISIDAGRLTYLFEFAKFSPHEVDESMRAEALSALLNIRAQVAVLTPPAPAPPALRAASP